MPIKTAFCLLFWLTLSLPFFNLTAQEWLQDNQQWSYDVTGGWSPSLYGVHTLSITGDTIIAGAECKVFTHEYPMNYYQAPRILFAYHQDDAVFASYGGDFFKIYDFSMEPGDTLELPDDKRYRVDLIGTTLVNNQEIRFQIVSIQKVYPFGSWKSSFLILEGIGFIGEIGENAASSCSYFFVNNIRCHSGSDGQDYHFKCFNDNDFIYDPYDLCITTPTKEPIKEVFKTFPNPASDFITLESPAGIKPKSVTLYDLLGKIIYSGRVEHYKINISHLPAQTYIMMITDQNEESYFSRIVVIR